MQPGSHNMHYHTVCGGVPRGELVGDMASRGSGGLSEELTGEGGSLYVSCVSVWTWGREGTFR